MDPGSDNRWESVQEMHNAQAEGRSQSLGLFILRSQVSSMIPK